MFRHRSQLRRWAAHVLLVWLFGALSGVANACWASSLVQPDGQHPEWAQQQVSAETSAPECGFHAGARPPAQEAASFQTQDSFSGPTCLTYCDGASVSIPAFKTAIDQPPELPAAAAAFGLAAPQPGRSRVHLLMPHREGGHAPSITIAFLRLTL